MNRKIMGLLLVVGTSVVLAGCTSGNASAKTGPAEAATSETQTPTPAQSDTQTAQPDAQTAQSAQSSQQTSQLAASGTAVNDQQALSFLPISM